VLSWTVAIRLIEDPKRHDLEGGTADVFGPGGVNGAAPPAVDVKSLHAKTGELTRENNFFRGSAQ
jgi:transposase